MVLILYELMINFLIFENIDYFLKHRLKKAKYQIGLQFVPLLTSYFFNKIKEKNGTRNTHQFLSQTSNNKKYTNVVTWYCKNRDN